VLDEFIAKNWVFSGKYAKSAISQPFVNQLGWNLCQNLQKNEDCKLVLRTQRLRTSIMPKNELMGLILLSWEKSVTIDLTKLRYFLLKMCCLWHTLYDILEHKACRMALAGFVKSVFIWCQVMKPKVHMTFIFMRYLL